MSSTAGNELPQPDLWRPRLPFNPEYDSDSLRVINLGTDEMRLKEQVLQRARGSLAMEAVRRKFYRAGELFWLNHCEQTAELATALAIKRGMDEPAGLLFIAELALAHDVGKCQPNMQQLTHMPYKFTTEQQVAVQLHAHYGAHMAAQAGFDDNHQRAIYGHHGMQRDAYPADVDLRACPDNQGFTPDIAYSIGCFAPADEYEAFTTARSYKSKLSRLEALALVDSTFAGPRQAVEALAALTDPDRAADLRAA